MSFVYRAILDKVKILTHLENFSDCLNSAKENIAKTNIDKLAVPLKGKRDKVIEEITAKTPFEKLYNDYTIIRDFYSLTKIKSYIDIALSCNATEKEGRLIITRALQVLGEHIKNTLYSPKFSVVSAEILLETLQSNTKEIVMNLRDSLCHADSLSVRSEIENCEDSFFGDLLSDLTAIKTEIINIIHRIKIVAIRELLSTIVECKDINSIKTILPTNHLAFQSLENELKETLSETPLQLETDLLEDLVSDFKKLLSYMTNYEKTLLEDLNKAVQVEKIKFEVVKSRCAHDIFILVNVLRMVKRELFYFNSRTTMNWITDYIAENFKADTSNSNLKKIETLLLKILFNLKPKIRSLNNELVNNFLKFLILFPDSKKRIKWLEEFRNILTKKKVPRRRFTSKCQKFDEKTKELLFNKRSLLQKILNENNLNYNVVENLFSCEKESKQQILVELLVFDIMAILGDSTDFLTHNPFFLDTDSCVLIGKNLRNHLAHGNVLNHILIGEDSTIVLLNARKIITEDLLRNERKIGTQVKMDFVKLKTSHAKDLSNVLNQQEMFTSFSEGNVLKMKDCIEKGADTLGKDRNLWTILHFAAKGIDIEVFKLSSMFNDDVDARDIKGQTALHVATSFKRRNIVEYLITEVKMFVDDKDTTGKTPLHIASENGWTEGVKILLKHKASTTLKDFFGFAALHHAIAKNNVDAALILLEMESNVDGNKAFGSLTALHLAARIGNICLLKTLLERNADVNCKFYDHFTSLHFAVEAGNLEIVKYLIEKGADVNAIDRSGTTSLHYAVRNCDDVIQNIQHEPVGNMVTDEHNFISPQTVARNRYLDLVEFLLKNESDVNKKNNAGRTPLHLAVVTGCQELVILLLRYNALVNAEDDKKVSALHLSAAFGHEHILTTIIEAGGDIHAKDIKGYTPLHRAALSGHLPIVRFLIAKGADINATSVDGITALHMSTDKKHSEIVKLFLRSKANIYAIDSFGNTPFYLSTANGTSELYLTEEIDINFRNDDGYTPLHEAALCGDENLVKYCINRCCNVNVQCSPGFTALHFAAEGGRLKIVELLLRNGSNINAKEKNGHTALDLAVVNNCESIVNVLLNKGAEWHLGLAHIAVEKGHMSILERLSQISDFDINYRSDNISLLDRAIIIGHINIVKYLLEKGIEINSEVNGITALHVASGCDNCEAAKLLLSKGANPNLKSIDFSPLHIASTLGHTQLVGILLKGGADVLIRDRNKKLAIEEAVKYNNLRVTELLLKVKEVDINFRTEDDYTLLHIAVKTGSLKMVKCLIRNGAQITYAFGLKPVHAAVVANHKDIVEYFLDHTFCINEPGKDGASLLHLAISFNRPAIFELLIKRGANVNVFDVNGSSPIYLAALEGHVDFFNVLLRKGAFYDTSKKIDSLNSLTLLKITKDNNIATSLTFVKNLFTKVKRNDIPGIKNILKDGTSNPENICLDAISTKKTSVLHYAAWKGYEGVIDLLLKHKANPNIRGKNGSIPLHYAAKFSHIGIVKMLLTNGAVYDDFTDSNRNPRYYAVDQGIICLLDILHDSFKKIEEGDSSVVDDLKKVSDICTAKAIMRAKNKAGRTLITASITANHPKVECLKALFQDDVLNNLQLATMNNEEVLSAYEKVLERRIEIFSVVDPGVLDIQQKIAVLLCKKRNFEESLNLLLQARRNIENLTEIHDVYNIRELECKIRAIQDIVEKKLTLNDLDEIFIQQKEMLGPNDINVLKTQLRMAVAFEMENKFVKALKLYNEIIKNNSNSSDVEICLVALQSLTNIAKILHKQGKFREAVKIMNGILEKFEEIFSPHHPIILIALWDLFFIFYEQREYEKSLKILQQILDSQKASLGNNHIDTLRTQLQIADVHVALGLHDEALRIYKENLGKVTPILGEDNPKIRESIHNIHLINILFESLASNNPESISFLDIIKSKQ
ncbi:uncharacterized protein NPIL_531972 [Nephila pilipes]|nr:uncharacterized protein NPIL_531972 [Nephila pilipes]